MKQGPSLEDERRAVLERIHASRAAYRRMLTDGDEPYDDPAHPHASDAPQGLHASGMQPKSLRSIDPAFPRSMSVRWAMDHPKAAIGGVLALLVLAPLALRAGMQARTGMAPGRMPFGARGRAGQDPRFARGPRSGGQGPYSSPYPPPYAAPYPSASAAEPYAGQQPGPYAPGQTPYGAYGAYGTPGTLGQAMHTGPMPSGVGPKMVVLGRAAITGLVTLGGMIARDPAKRQMAIRAFTIASAYLAKRRADKKQAQDLRGEPRH